MWHGQWRQEGPIHLNDLQIPWPTKTINPIRIADKIRFIQAMEREATVKEVASSIDALNLEEGQHEAMWNQTGVTFMVINQALANLENTPATKAVVQRYGHFDVHAVELALMAMLDETRRVASHLIPQEQREER